MEAQAVIKQVQERHILMGQDFRPGVVATLKEITVLVVAVAVAVQVFVMPEILQRLDRITLLALIFHQGIQLGVMVALLVAGLAVEEQVHAQAQAAMIMVHLSLAYLILVLPDGVLGLVVVREARFNYIAGSPSPLLLICLE
jgi:hypothetical protein